MRNSYFDSRQHILKGLASVYLVLLVLAHWRLPQVHVWIIAAFFSIAMNFTYLTEAFALKRFFKLELFVALSLIVASLLGLIISPIWLIAAIFGHGVWDFIKQLGAGLPFYKWYTSSCLVVDVLYSSALLFYWCNQS